MVKPRTYALSVFSIPPANGGRFHAVSTATIAAAASRTMTAIVAIRLRGGRHTPRAAGCGGGAAGAAGATGAAGGVGTADTTMVGAGALMQSPRAKRDGVPARD